MTGSEELAEKIFGGAAPPAQQNAAPDGGDLASRIYGRGDDADVVKPETQPDKTEDSSAERPKTEKPLAERVFGDSADSESTEERAEGKDDAGEALDLEAEAEELGLDTSDPAFEEFSTVAADLKLDKDGVAKLVQFDQERTVAAWDKIRADWIAEAQQDPDFDSNVASARKLLSEYGDETLLADLSRFGLGNHPSLIKFTARVAKALGY